MFKKVVYNTFFQIVGKFVTASATLIVTLLIAKSLGPTGYGDFTKVFVFIAYFYTIADFGLNNIYIKFSHRQDDKNLIRYLVGLRIIISISLAIIAIITSSLLPYNPTLGFGFSPIVKIAIAIASLTVVTQALITASNAYFQKHLSYNFSAIAAASGAIVVLTCCIIFKILNPSLLFYVSAYVFGGIAIVTTAFILIRIKFKEIITPLFNLNKFLMLTKGSLPVALALIFNLIYFRVDVFILSYTRPTSEVGLYGLAYQFFEATLSIPIFFANSLYPLLSRLYQQDQIEYKKQVKKWLVLAILVSVVLAVALSVISFLIPIIYDYRFFGSQKSLFILSIGLPFFFISAILWHVLLIHDLQKYLSVVYLLGAIFNIVTNILFIPQFGYVAASITTIVSEALIALMLILVIRIAKKPAS